MATKKKTTAKQGSADVAPGDLDYAANAGADEKEKGKPTKKLKAGEHLPGPDFRQRVENTAAGDLNQDPREPYPTGNPPDPKELVTGATIVSRDNIDDPDVARYLYVSDCGAYKLANATAEPAGVAATPTA